tara:strand:- start:897 stop:1313 length:417 start_codon:yes stop_codon:yes gene_type:complete
MGDTGDTGQDTVPPDFDSRFLAARDPKSGKLTKGGPGRKPGSRNHRTKVSAQQKLREVEDKLGVTIDPLEGMAHIAADRAQDVQIRLTALRELAKYVYPQRKAVDMTIEEQHGDLTTMSDVDLESIIEGTWSSADPEA